LAQSIGAMASMISATMSDRAAFGLRAAINHHREVARCEKIVSVVSPQKSVGHDRWPTRLIRRGSGLGTSERWFG